MIPWSLGTIYGVGFGITLTVMLIIKVLLLGLGIHQERKSLIKTVFGLLLWPITWGVVIHSIWKLYMEEDRRERKS